MRTRSIVGITVIAIATFVAACGGNGASSDGNKVIKSTTAGSLSVTLASPTGEVKNGDNDLIITFADSSAHGKFRVEMRRPRTESGSMCRARSFSHR